MESQLSMGGAEDPLADSRAGPCPACVVAPASLDQVLGEPAVESPATTLLALLGSELCSGDPALLPKLSAEPLLGGDLADFGLFPLDGLQQYVGEHFLPLSGMEPGFPATSPMSGEAVRRQLAVA